MGRVFLSHSHEDKEFVRRLAADLVAAGVGVWLDEAEIKIGDSLIRKIEEGISSVEYVAACLSQHSVKSNWVTKELNIAMTEEIKGRRMVVLPLLIQDCEIPLFLRDKYYADFREPERYDSELRKLLLRISHETAIDLENAVIDCERAESLIETAGIPGTRSQVIDYLIKAIPKRKDPAERHWIYVALGRIGGKKAKDTIRAGLEDGNEFAREGARMAWEMMRD